MENQVSRKVTWKDIIELRKPLSLGGKIKVAGSSIIRLPGRAIGLLKRKWKNGVAKLNNYVADEKQDIIDKKVGKIDTKIEMAAAVHDKFSSIDAFNKAGTMANDYLKAVEERQEKLAEKREKAANKKFGLMRVSLMGLKKLTSNRIKAAQERRTARKNAKKELMNKREALAEASSIYSAQVELINRMEEFKKTFGCTAEEYLKNSMSMEQEANVEEKPKTNKTK